MKLKRTVYILLVLLMLGSLAACGNAEPEVTQTTENGSTQTSTYAGEKDASEESTSEVPATPDTRDDTISKAFYDDGLLTSHRGGRPFPGGSIWLVRTDFIAGKDYPIYGNEDYMSLSLFHMFNEESKLIYPLCFDFACTHDTVECFANSMQLRIGKVFPCEQGITAVYGQNPVTAEIYSYDGTVLGKKEFDMSSLVRSDGTAVNKNAFFSGNQYCLYGDTVYIDICDYDPYSEAMLWEEGIHNELNHWIISYDLKAEEFAVVCNFTVADPFSTIVFSECSDSYIGMNFGGRYAYCSDIIHGTVAEIDCTETIDRLRSMELIGEDDYIECLFPIHKYVYTVGSSGRLYFDMETLEPLEVSPLEKSMAYTYELMCHDGEIYYYYIKPDGDPEELYFVRKSDGTVIEISRVFSAGAHHVAEVVSYAEKGAIFRYFDNGTYEQNEQYTVTENMQEVTYQKAHRYVYVTYEDMLDGTIDEPWYYQPETGTFGQ